MYLKFYALKQAPHGRCFTGKANAVKCFFMILFVDFFKKEISFKYSMLKANTDGVQRFVFYVLCSVL